MASHVNNEYFNNLNYRDDDMVKMGIITGMRTWMRQICTSPSLSYTQSKKSGIPHAHTHTQSLQEFPVKMEMDSSNTHENKFICYPYLTMVVGYVD